MYRRFLLLPIVLFALSPCLAANPYHNPALNPVKFLTATQHPDLPLIQNGKANFAIVADLAAEKQMRVEPSKAALGKHRLSVQMSVDALLDALERCYALKVPVLAPDSPDLQLYPYKIVLGKNALADAMGIDPFALAEEGFRLQTYDGGVVIAGYDGSLKPGYYQTFDRPSNACNGTLYGVYDFIERFFGMRFYFPGIGTYIPPRQSDLLLKSTAYQDAPKYRRTNTWRIVAEFSQKKWPWKDLPNDSVPYRGAYRAYETATFGGIETPHPFQVAKDYPEQIETIFYRDAKGKLRHSPDVYSENSFDVTNFAFADLLIDYWKMRLSSENKKGGTIFGDYLIFGQCDTNRIFDNPAAKLLPRKPPVESYNEMSEVYGHFYYQLAERVKKELPGKRVSVLAYKNYIAAPESIERFPDNFTIVTCAGTPDYVREKSHRAFVEGIYNGWNAKISGRPIVYSYPGSPQGVFYGEFFGEFLRTMVDKIDQRDIFPCVQPAWGVYYSKYLLLRALWNPEFDNRAAMSEHWRLLYGEAAGGHLAAFYDLLLDLWNTKFIPNFTAARRSIPHPDKHFLFSEVYNRNVALRLQEFLRLAHAAVSPNSIEEERLVFFEKGWDSLIETMFTYQGYKEPSYKVAMLPDKKTIKIDAVLDEPEWEKAATFTLQGINFAAPAPKSKNVVKMCWNEQGIYLACTGYSPYLLAKTGIWNGDGLELFLSPGLKKEFIFQIAVGANGEKMGTLSDLVYQRRDGWKTNGVQCAVGSSEESWTLEMFVPFEELDGVQKPDAGDEWYANLVVNRHLPAPETAAFSITLQNNYNYHLYGKLYFSGNCE